MQVKTQLFQNQFVKNQIIWAWAALGAGVGTALGVVLGNIAIDLGVGVGAGVAIGFALAQKNGEDHKKEEE